MGDDDQYMDDTFGVAHPDDVDDADYNHSDRRDFAHTSDVVVVQYSKDDEPVGRVAHVMTVVHQHVRVFLPDVQEVEGTGIDDPGHDEEVVLFRLLLPRRP
jgi:hypothetical protein